MIPVMPVIDQLCASRKCIADTGQQLFSRWRWLLSNAGARTYSRSYSSIRVTMLISRFPTFSASPRLWTAS